MVFAVYAVRIGGEPAFGTGGSAGHKLSAIEGIATNVTDVGNTTTTTTVTETTRTGRFANSVGAFLTCAATSAAATTVAVVRLQIDAATGAISQASRADGDTLPAAATGSCRTL